MGEGSRDEGSRDEEVDLRWKGEGERMGMGMKVEGWGMRAVGGGEVSGER